MPMETPHERIDNELKDKQLYTLKIELLEFLIKMKSNGFLETVEYKDIPTEIEHMEF